MNQRSVVITAIGAVSPFGVGSELLQRALFEGRCAIRPIERFDAAKAPVRVAAEVPPLACETASDCRHARIMSLPMKLAMVAAGECLRNAALPPDESRRRACYLGIGRHDGTIEDFGEAFRRSLDHNGQFDRGIYYAKGVRAKHPLRLLTFIPNIAVTFVCLEHGIEGEANTFTSEGVASLHAIAEAAVAIRDGLADVAICGGTDGRVDAFGLARPAALGLLASGPDAVSRPYDRRREGAIQGEGAVFLVLEHAEHARARGAQPLAEITAHCHGADAFHPYRAHPEGRGLAATMAGVLERAGCEPMDVDLIVGAAASLPDWDAAEANAINAVFSGCEPAVTALAGHIGRTSAAAGAFGVAAGVWALRDQIASPVLGTELPDEGAPPGLVLRKSVSRHIEHVIVNATAVGGQCSSLLLRRVS
jgi:3-oxoacyl-[acyl-carrier-protein] synthase II